MLAAIAFAALLVSSASPDGVSVTTVEHAGTAYTVVTLDLAKVDLDLYGQRGETAAPTFDELERALAQQGRRLVVATNAGIYEPGRVPTGLHVERGEQEVALNRKKGEGNFYLAPNGVFAVDDTGASVTATPRFQTKGRRLRLATQSGPLLVEKGSLHPAFRPESENRLVRSGVGVDGKGRVVLVLSEGPVRFYDLATLFRDRLACPDALYLDGVISTLRAPGHPERKGAPEYAGILAVTVPAP